MGHFHPLVYFPFYNSARKNLEKKKFLSLLVILKFVLSVLNFSSHCLNSYFCEKKKINTLQDSYRRFGCHIINLSTIIIIDCKLIKEKRFGKSTL